MIEFYSIMWKRLVNVKYIICLYIVMWIGIEL